MLVKVSSNEMFSYSIEMVNYSCLCLQQYLDTLRDKRDSAPYVCDMTLWYLYTGAASPELAQLWGWPANPNVPTVPRKRFCDGYVYGIDHQHGHLRDGGKGLKTIHYQGGEKSKC